MTVKLSGTYTAGHEVEAEPLTIEQAQALTVGTHLLMRVTNPYHKRYRQFVQVRVTGKPKLLKLSPDRVKVPFKYGLYESGYITETNLDDFTL